ncbi:MAG TPA: hypothetical protein VF618_12225 [Thermoanaerobaculia bacterium]
MVYTLEGGVRIGFAAERIERELGLFIPRAARAPSMGASNARANHGNGELRRIHESDVSNASIARETISERVLVQPQSMTRRAVQGRFCCRHEARIRSPDPGEANHADR